MTPEAEVLIERTSGGGTLSQDESAVVFSAILDAAVPEQLVERFLRAMADRGETAPELVGAARALRARATRIRCDEPCAIDTCGTGGGGISTINVSTAVAIVAAGAGAVVAKHGNTTHTRASGSTEAMRALGVDTEAPPPVVENCLRHAGLAYLNAARLHPALGRLAALRARMGRPTIFNRLGPLANPAGVRRQLVGVPRPELLDRIAEALAHLGAEYVVVACGGEGLCDLSITGPSRCIEIHDGRRAEYTVDPVELGLATAPLDALRADSPQQSAGAILALLSSEVGPRRHHVLLNAAAALVVAGRAENLREGLALAGQAIDSGAAMHKLEQLRRLSNLRKETR